MNTRSKLARNPVIWLGSIILIYLLIAELGIDEAIKASNTDREHQSQMANSPSYAAQFAAEQIAVKLKKAAWALNPKQQVEAMLEARRSGVDPAMGCVNAAKKMGETSEALAACIYERWAVGPGLSTSSNTTLILDKIEAAGMPSPGVLKHYRMLGEGCKVRADNKWCRDFDRAMECKGHCIGARVAGSADKY